MPMSEEKDAQPASASVAANAHARTLARMDRLCMDGFIVVSPAHFAGATAAGPQGAATSTRQ